MKVYEYIIYFEGIEVTEFENVCVHVRNFHNKRKVACSYNFSEIYINELRINAGWSDWIRLITCYKLTKKELKKLKNELIRNKRRYGIV